MNLVGCEDARVDRADAAVFGDDEVRDEVMQMEVRVAGDRRIDEIGSALGAVLHSERRPGGVMGERHPADVAGIDAFCSAGPFAGRSKVLGGVAEGGVVSLVDCVADQNPFRLRRGEFRGKRNGLVGGEYEVEAGVRAAACRPGLAIVGAPGLEEGIKLRVARRAAGIFDAERSGHLGGHVGPPGRGLPAARVVVRELFAGLKDAAVGRDAGNGQRFGFGRILG